MVLYSLIILLLVVFSIVWYGNRPDPQYKIITEMTDGLSVMVFPFSYEGPDNQRTYLADGIGVELSTRLSRFQDLAVISYFSSRIFKDEGGTLRTARRDLNV